MERYEEEGEDSDNETDPEQLLNEWLGELDSLTVVSFCEILNFFYGEPWNCQRRKFGEVASSM